jgi:hypothetical protein
MLNKHVKARLLTTHHIIIDGKDSGKICEVAVRPTAVYVRATFYISRRNKEFREFKFKRNELVPVKRRKVES